MPDPTDGALLGIDFGLRTVGLAIAHRLTGSARPLEPLRYRSFDALLDGIEAVLDRWRPATIIVGLPLHDDGSESEMSRQVRQFAEQLATRRANLNIRFQDERMSSLAAAERHASRRQQGRARRADARRLDSVAAGVILESWMGNNP